MARVNQRTAAFAVDIVSLRSTFSVRATRGEARGVMGAGAGNVDIRASAFAELAQLSERVFHTMGWVTHKRTG